jgi:hypothetical protein
VGSSSGSDSTVQGILGNLIINGLNGATNPAEVVVNDSGDTTARTVNMTGTALTGLAPATISYFNFCSTIVKGGSAAGDSITMSTRGGSGNAFTGTPGKSTLQGFSYYLEADNFANVTAVSYNSGNSTQGGTLIPPDSAVLKASPTALNNTFTATPYSATLSGPKYSIKANNFYSVTAYATTNTDSVSLQSLALSSSQLASGDRSTLTYNPASQDTILSGPGYYLEAIGFVAVTAQSNSSVDVANLHSNDGNATFVGLENSSFLCAAGWGIQVNNFAHVVVDSDMVDGNITSAYLESFSGDGSTPTLSGSQGNWNATLAGAGWSIQVSGCLNAPQTMSSWSNPNSTAQYLDAIFQNLESSWNTWFPGTYSLNIVDPVTMASDKLTF